MIPLQGLIAQVLGVVALVVIWERPIPVLWWCILGLLIAEWYFKALTKDRVPNKLSICRTPVSGKRKNYLAHGPKYHHGGSWGLALRET